MYLSRASICIDFDALNMQCIKVINFLFGIPNIIACGRYFYAGVGGEMESSVCKRFGLDSINLDQSATDVNGTNTQVRKLLRGNVERWIVVVL